MRSENLLILEDLIAPLVMMPELTKQQAAG